eukprot:3260939-Pleurochrysis_carterae.AAC.4
MAQTSISRLRLSSALLRIAHPHRRLPQWQLEAKPVQAQRQLGKEVELPSLDLAGEAAVAQSPTPNSTRATSKWQHQALLLATQQSQPMLLNLRGCQRSSALRMLRAHAYGEQAERLIAMPLAFDSLFDFRRVVRVRFDSMSPAVQAQQPG